MKQESLIKISVILMLTGMGIILVGVPLSLLNVKVLMFTYLLGSAVFSAGAILRKVYYIKKGK